jgi:hypothetical protein
MFDDISRRDWLKAVGAVGAGAIVPRDGLLADIPRAPVESAAAPTALGYAPGDIVDLTSTSEIFTPPPNV